MTHPTNDVQPATDEQVAILRDSFSIAMTSDIPFVIHDTKKRAADVLSLIARIEQAKQERDEYKKLFGEYAECLQKLCMDRLYKTCEPVSCLWPARKHVDTINEAVDFLLDRLATLTAQLATAREALQQIGNKTTNAGRWRVGCDCFKVIPSIGAISSAALATIDAQRPANAGEEQK